jgi:hypothetical protein
MNDHYDAAVNIADADVYMLANHIGETAWRCLIEGDGPFDVGEPVNYPAEGDEFYQWYFVSSYLSDLLEDAGETILRIEDGDLWARKGCGYHVAYDIARALKAREAREGDE